MPVRTCAVIGLGLFGRRVALTMAERGVDVMVVDKDPALIETMKDQVASALCLDVTMEKALLESGVCEADVVVVAIGEDMESSILTTALLKRHGARHIVARSHSDLHAQVLGVVGAVRTIDPEEEMGVRLAEELYAPDVHARIRLSTGQEVLEVAAHKSLVGKAVQDLRFREKYRLNIIAIKRRVPVIEKDGRSGFGYEVNRLPRPTDVIEADDVIVVIGDEEMIRQFLDLLR